jgi:hypothetical protein
MLHRSDHAPALTPVARGKRCRPLLNSFKRRSWLQIRRESGECRLKGFASARLLAYRHGATPGALRAARIGPSYAKMFERVNRALMRGA